MPQSALAEERARKREDLLEATEKLLEPVAAATRRKNKRLTGAEQIGARVGKVIGKYKMAKHFDWDIDDEGCFGYRRNGLHRRRGGPRRAVRQHQPRRNVSTPKAVPTSA